MSSWLFGYATQPAIVGELHEQFPARCDLSLTLVDQHKLPTTPTRPVGFAHEVASFWLTLGFQPSVQKRRANLLLEINLDA